MNVDPNDLLLLFEDLSDETIAHLYDFCRDFADAIANRYCARLIDYDHRRYEREAIAEGRAGEHHLELVSPFKIGPRNELGFLEGGIPSDLLGPLAGRAEAWVPYPVDQRPIPFGHVVVPRR